MSDTEKAAKKPAAKKATRKSAPAAKARAGASPARRPAPGRKPVLGPSLVVRQVKSAIGSNRRQRATLRGLRLGRPGKWAQLEDTPAVRGMIQKVIHLVKLEEA